MSTIKKILLGVAGVFVLLLALKFVADFRYFHEYDPSTPFNVKVESVEDRDAYQRVKFSFDSIPGEPIPTLLTLPKVRAGRVPCVIFLHGIGQKKDFLDEITTPFNEAGFAMACFDQYMQGERKLDTKNPLAQLIAFRRRAASTVNDTRRLVDYLQQHPDIDPDRIYMVGASYGAITGSTATALEPRIKATVLVYGGAGISNLLEARLIKQEVGAWLTPLKMFANFVLWPADPIRYAGKIAPRPVLLQNGKDDGLISTAAAEALQNAVQEPKKITWYEGDHIGMDEATVRTVLDEGLQWIKEQDARVTAELRGTQKATVAGNLTPAAAH
ncbi:MAG: acetylxylan esterase [Candidatus Hydrogenedentes bacterium]|nr:acetylxylan esterase [Candidatus Hydrogenedentota bacterium]